MVKIRLQRFGAKKAPFYHIVVADSRSPRDGRFIETVGTYDPVKADNNISVKEDRVAYWLDNGAQPTDTVKSILSKSGVWATYKNSKVKKAEKTTKKSTKKEA